MTGKFDYSQVIYDMTCVALACDFNHFCCIPPGTGEALIPKKQHPKNSTTQIE
jgi:hypothetical protein